MKIGQRGTARNGQVGTIIEVFTNAVRFQSDTGAQFTVLNCEFVPDGAKAIEVGTIVHTALDLFGKIDPRDGFHYLRSVVKGAVSHIVKAIPRYKAPEETVEQIAARVDQARNDISNGVAYR